MSDSHDDDNDNKNIESIKSKIESIESNIDNEKTSTQETSTEETSKQEKNDFMPKEAMLELVEADGLLVLRDITKKEDPLVSIDFSDTIKEMLGDDMQNIGQQMIHSAIQAFMKKQVTSWHAHIHDEEPTNYS